MDPCGKRGEKVRLMCSHGGTVLLPLPDQPQRRRLRYIGGETRVVSLPRRFSLQTLVLKLASLLSPSAPFLIKYHVPPEDALRSLSSDAHLRHMLFEGDRLPPPSRIRLFLFPLNSLLDIDGQEMRPTSSPSPASAPSLASIPPIRADSICRLPPPPAPPTEPLVFGGKAFSSSDKNERIAKPPQPQSFPDRWSYSQGFLGDMVPHQQLVHHNPPHPVMPPQAFHPMLDHQRLSQVPLQVKQDDMVSGRCDGPPQRTMLSNGKAIPSVFMGTEFSTPSTTQMQMPPLPQFIHLPDRKHQQSSQIPAMAGNPPRFADAQLSVAIKIMASNPNLTGMKSEHALHSQSSAKWVSDPSQSLHV